MILSDESAFSGRAGGMIYPWLLLSLGRFSVGVCKRTFLQHFGLGRRSGAWSMKRRRK